MFALELPGLKTVKRTFRRMGHQEAALERMPAEVWECAYRAGRLPSFKTGWLTLLERVLRLNGPNPELSLGEGELRQVRQPVYFIWGDNDPFGGPDVGRRAAEIMPNATLEVISGGHLPWIDEPTHCGQTIHKFLESYVSLW
jgi:pimeloyl-ACP methyl ester carboxylesterase